MFFDFLTPDLFDALVWATIAVGGIFAAIRLYQDLARPPQPPKGIQRRVPRTGGARPPGRPPRADDRQQPDSTANDDPDA